MPVSPVRFGSGPALALAHGAGGGVADNFMTLSAQLKGRTLIGVDYPGSGGRPAQPTPLRLEDLADELVGAAVDAGFDRFPVLGLSLGSAVAVTAAIRHPEHVSGLVLVVGFAVPDVQAVAFGELYASLAREDRADDLARFLLVATGSPAKLEKTPPTTVELLADYHRGRAAAMIPHVELVRDIDIRPLLPRIVVPALVIGASHDRTVLPSSTRALADGIPRSQYLEYDGAGHLFSVPESGRLAGDITEFLAQQGL
ncbi:alpha/beta fold hydrolase [Tsukamurella sp. 8F]|uniref:alpha/beta fold hydrolase n=1 Tax=unclassified Tsukamurella TaxID=2633480 RepID=UPI0023BA092A|nr:MULTISPECIES: alpha/beta fold hydrolase [unclassified Tsukamurella]MDF0531231.1 alpha/beta fold hydrolase [Tsukamurella sp. 8J]MDF0588500.1 alpha/beta fold hydrolase [Tsukamurella sp. 8F]